MDQNCTGSIRAGTIKNAGHKTASEAHGVNDSDDANAGMDGPGKFPAARETLMDFAFDNPAETSHFDDPDFDAFSEDDFHIHEHDINDEDPNDDKVGNVHRMSFVETKNRSQSQAVEHAAGMEVGTVIINPNTLTADMHESHQLFFVNGHIFCQICGRWSHRRTKLLRNECSPIPEGQCRKWRRYSVRRLSEGKYPIAGRNWPNGNKAVVNYPVYRLEKREIDVPSEEVTVPERGSAMKGVNFDKRHQCWISSWHINGKQQFKVFRDLAQAVSFVRIIRWENLSSSAISLLHHLYP